MSPFSGAHLFERAAPDYLRPTKGPTVKGGGLDLGESMGSVSCSIGRPHRRRGRSVLPGSMGETVEGLLS